MNSSSSSSASPGAIDGAQRQQPPAPPPVGQREAHVDRTPRLERRAALQPDAVFAHGGRQPEHTPRRGANLDGDGDGGAQAQRRTIIGEPRVSYDVRMTLRAIRGMWRGSSAACLLAGGCGGPQFQPLNRTTLRASQPRSIVAANTPLRAFTLDRPGVAAAG